MVYWLRFELHYLFDNISILELHTAQLYMTSEQWRKFIFAVYSYTGWPQKVSHFQIIKKIVLNRIKTCQ